ncbi:MAG: precorrin-8X/cobalt-precorrin-8 methylmutase [Frankiaceae bacterium]|nr:precorrin-8X/cobalt-precorrin-8 methylmutase [Frankiaceae bacterium]
MTRLPHPIERESYAILRSRVDTTGYPPLTRAVIERVIHATADVALADDIVCDEVTLAAAVEALRGGARIVADVGMVAAGITSRPVVSLVGSPEAARLAADAGITRSAAAVRLALAHVGAGAVWVVGCAPTALTELLALADSARPALIVGMPVGFVGAVESKKSLRDSGLPAVSNVSERGGSAMASAAVNALLYAGEDAP